MKKVDLDLALDLIVMKNLTQVPDQAQVLALMMETPDLDQAATPTQMKQVATPTQMNQAVTLAVMMKVVQMTNLITRTNQSSHLHLFNKLCQA